MIRVGDIVVVSDDNDCLYCTETVIHDIRNQYFIVVDMLVDNSLVYPASACKIMNGLGFFSWISTEHLNVLW